MILTATPTQVVDDRMIRRIDAVRTVLQKVVRILTGLKVTVHIVPPGMSHINAPGWTDGADIYMNGDYISAFLAGKPSLEDYTELVLLLKGLIYHETSHILYSPRSTDEVHKRAVQQAQQQSDFTWWYSYNALEDQRIETWFVASYATAKKYFEASSLEWLVKTPKSLESAHALIHGRKYLPAKVRKQAREVFVAKHGESLAQEFADVIDEYLTVRLPTDTNKAWKCIQRYHDLLAKITPDPSQLPPPPNEDLNPHSAPYGNEDHVVHKGQAKQQKQKEAAQKAKEHFDEPSKAKDPKESKDDDEKSEQPEATEPSDSNKDEQGDDGNDDQPDQETDSGSTDAADGDDESAGAGDDSQDSDDESDAGSGDGDGDNESESEADQTNGDPGNGIGNEGGSSTPSSEQDLLDAARDALNDALNDEALQADIDATVETIREIMQRDDGLGALMAPYRNVPVPGERRTLVRRIVTNLSQIRLEMEAERVNRLVAGRLDVRRAMVAQDQELDVFNQWVEHGEEVGGIEAVILLDLSGSMQWQMASASQTMWAVKAAFDKLDIRTTVIGYSNDWCVLYRPGEKAPTADYRLYDSIGGTVAKGAIQKAHEILTNSDHPNRVLVSITDGGWFDNDNDLKPFMDDMHDKGTTSLLIGLGGLYGGSIHHHQYGESGSIEDVPKLIALLVRGVMQRVIKQNA